MREENERGREEGREKGEKERDIKEINEEKGEREIERLCASEREVNCYYIVSIVTH